MIYGTPFRGIFYSFGVHYPDAPITDLVDVTASSTAYNRGNVLYVIDPKKTYSSSEEGWISTSEENSSITVTLLRDNLTLSSYALRSRLEYETNFPLEWMLEGSNDQTNWELLHHKTRGDELKGLGRVGRWKCPTDKAFKSFRLTQIGVNSYTDEAAKYVFSMNKFELYGKLGISFASFTCRPHSQSMSFVCLVINLLLNSN